MKKTKTLSLVGTIARTLLGLVFIFSGFVKAIDPLGTTYKIEDYLGAFGGFFTALTPLAEPAAWLLICFELVLGVMLALNIWKKVSGWLALAMLCVMTPLTLYLAISNPITDCGCFGDAVVLSNWATFWKNVVLLALTGVLLYCNKYIRNTWLPMLEVIITCGTLGFALGFMTYSRTHLPVVDFRPYKIGNNIPEQMEIPDGAAVDKYDVTFIYEKDGVQQEFTMENYPKGDSTWVFVDQKSTLIEKGYEAPIHDFALILTNEDGEAEDITYDVLESEEEVTLAIMYKLEKTDRKQVDKLNALAARLAEEGKAFYAVTGSGTDVIEAWKNETGVTYPICTCDGVTLKTIVRANPGVITIKNGNVTGKYNLRNK